jgi:hypothetical protein
MISVPSPSFAAQIEMLHDLSFLGQQLSVYVLSTGGWGWAFGVAIVKCTPWTREAAQELERVAGVKALAARIVVTDWATAVQQLQNQASVISGHLAWDHLEPGTMTEEQEALTGLVKGQQHVWLFTAPRYGLSERFLKANLERSGELQHRSLGGFTRARIAASWCGPKGAVGGIQPGRQRNPLRPLGKFLEPSVRLTRWTTKESVTTFGEVPGTERAFDAVAKSRHRGRLLATR